MKQNVNLLEGSIAGGLGLALPIMGTSLIQMAVQFDRYDMDRKNQQRSRGGGGSCGVCICGFPMDFPFWQEWRTGAHGTDAGCRKKRKREIMPALHYSWGFSLEILYGLVAVLGNRPLIGFFHLNSEVVIKQARWYPDHHLRRYCI